MVFFYQFLGGLFSLYSDTGGGQVHIRSEFLKRYFQVRWLCLMMRHNDDDYDGDLVVLVIIFHRATGPCNHPKAKDTIMLRLINMEIGK